MPTYDPHTLVTFGGTLAELAIGDEIWQCGVRGVNDPGDGPVGHAQLADLVTAIATQVSATPNLLAWFQVVGSQMSSTASLNWVKAANIGLSGRKLRNGRVYPPNNAAGIVPGTAQIGTGTQDLLVTSAKTLLGALAQSADEYNFVPCVVSPAGGHEPITGVRVGNVYDVHRSRKNAAVETYHASAWP